MFRRLIAGETMPATSGAEALRLDVQMQYSVRAGGGTAAVRWTDPHQGGEPIQAVLVALLYGRILCIHRETRQELFRRVDELAKQNVKTEGHTGFDFTPWKLHVGLGGGDHELWPWYLVRPDILPEPKTYTAI